MFLPDFVFKYNDFEFYFVTDKKKMIFYTLESYGTPKIAEESP